jgi:hypothetical protein
VTARKPLLELLVSMLTVRDVLVSCLGANARYRPHMTVPCPVFALCDSMSAAIPLGLGIALQRPDRHVVALAVDWAALARAAGLRHVASVGDVAGLREAFARASGGGAGADRRRGRVRSGRGDSAVLRASRRDPRALPPLAPPRG